MLLLIIVNAQAEPLPRVQVFKLIENYIQSIKQNNLTMLKKCLSDNFYIESGGDTKWKQMHKIGQQLKGGSIQDFQLFPTNKKNEYRVKFSIKFADGREDKMESSEFFLVSRSAGSSLYKIIGHLSL